MFAAAFPETKHRAIFRALVGYHNFTQKARKISPFLYIIVTLQNIAAVEDHGGYILCVSCLSGHAQHMQHERDPHNDDRPAYTISTNLQHVCLLPFFEAACIITEALSYYPD